MPGKPGWRLKRKFHDDLAISEYSTIHVAKEIHVLTVMIVQGISMYVSNPVAQASSSISSVNSADYGAIDIFELHAGIEIGRRRYVVGGDLLF